MGALQIVSDFNIDTLRQLKYWEKWGIQEKSNEEDILKQLTKRQDEVEYCYNVLENIEILHAMCIQVENIDNLRFILKGEPKRDYKRLKKIEKQIDILEDEKTNLILLQEEFLQFENYWEWLDQFILKEDFFEIEKWTSFMEKVKIYESFIALCKKLPLDCESLGFLKAVESAILLEDCRTQTLAYKEEMANLKNTIGHRMIQKQEITRQYDRINRLCSDFFENLEDCFNKNYVRREINMITKKLSMLGEKIPKGISKEEELLKINQNNYRLMNNRLIEVLMKLRQNHNNLFLKGAGLLIYKKQCFGKKMYGLLTYKKTIVQRLEYQKKQSEKYENKWEIEDDTVSKQHLQDKLAYHEKKLKLLQNQLYDQIELTKEWNNVKLLQEKLNALYEEKLRLKIKQNDKARLIEEENELSYAYDYLKLMFAK